MSSHVGIFGDARFDSDQMFWQRHYEPPLSALPENFHGPAPTPQPENEENYPIVLYESASNAAADQPQSELLRAAA